MSIFKQLIDRLLFLQKTGNISSLQSEVGKYLPNGEVRRLFSSFLVQYAIESSEIDNCLTLFRNLLSIFNGDFGLSMGIAELYEILGDQDKALCAYTLAQSAIPGHGKPFTKRILMQLRKCPPNAGANFNEAATRPTISMSTLGSAGRFGNQLFQYAFLRCYAKKFNLLTQTPEWIGSHIFTCPDGKLSQALPQVNATIDDLSNDCSVPRLGNHDVLGYFNEHTKPLFPFQGTVRDIFKPSMRFKPIFKALDNHLLACGRKIVAIHLRRGDFGYGHYWISPESWYIKWVEEIMRDNPNLLLYIATDDLSTVSAFAKYNPITQKDLPLSLGDLNFLLDFHVLRMANYLAISNSTFSFFASLLNEQATKFFRPNPFALSLEPFEPWNAPVLIKAEASEVRQKALEIQAGGNLQVIDENKSQIFKSDSNYQEKILQKSSPSFVFFLSPRKNYRDPIISSNEIFCSPDTEDDITGGLCRCLKTPSQPFDVADYFSERGLLERPDLILVKADATGRNFPRNLGSFKCPKVLLVGVTHFLSQPIRKLIDYAKSEPFDFIIMDVTRHHAHWFREAGLKNVHWLPAFEYNPHFRAVKKNPSHRLTFVGQAGAHHPFRKNLLERLKVDGFPLEVLQAPQAKAADIYSDSLSTLNITLNGDINMRFFEGLAAGGFLLCDRLPDWTGLDRLFTAGEHFDLFGSYGELVEKLRYYFSKPDLVHRIKSAGHARLVEFHSPEVKRREFHDLVFNGIENPIYSLDEDSKTTVLFSKMPAMEMLPAYEFFQELHRNRSRLVFYCAAADMARIRRFVDLPRVECKSHEEWVEVGKADNVEFPEERILHLAEGFDAQALEGIFMKSQPRFVFAPGGDSLPLSNWGFIQKEVGVFECTRPVSGIARRARALNPEAGRPLLEECLDTCINDTEALEVADACDALGLQDLRRDALLRALFLNRDSLSALFQLADLCLESGAEEDVAILLHEAHRIQALPPEINTLREDLGGKFFAATHFAQYKEAVSGGASPSPTSAYSILVVTNLFPPQELGGYGRKIWEFSNGLIKRGHRLKILTGDASYLQKAPDAGEPDLEPLVERSLVLQGEWKNGKTQHLGDLTFLRRAAEANKEKVLAAVNSFKPDFVLLGNFDFLGIDILKALVSKKMPVLHSLGNQTPGYPPQESIESPLYTIAPASDWLGKNLLDQGYKVSKLSTVYPGARVDRFFKQFLPDIRRLRIAFAGLVMPYKGAHVLMGALNILQQSGIEFEADFAGDSTDEGYTRTLKQFAQNNGMGAKVRFNGFLDRQGLAALFARCNVLVFPTQVPEAFGISQVEAMASGLIVITSGTGGTQEVIRHGIDGLVFEMGNAVSLAQTLATLATNKELRDKLQINSQKRAMQFSVTNSVVRIESIAKDLISLKNGKNQLEQTGSDESRLISTNATLQDAQAVFNEGRLSDAEDICREILGKDERCAGAWHLMAKMAALQGDLETAGEFSSVACELDPQNAEFVRELAEVFLRKKELEPAEQQVRRALEMAPESPEGLMLLGRILAEKDDKSAALEAFQDALRLRKDYAEGFSHYATALQKFGRGKDAISQIRKACALEPDSVEFQTNLAILLEQNARYVDALAAYGKAARMNPNVGFVWFRQGKLLNGLKRYAESIPALAKAISLPGQLGDYHYEYGLALHMSKRFQEALVHYEKALSMGYNTAALQCNRGVIYKDLRKGGDAIMAFHAAVKMDPSNVSYLNNLGAAALELGLNSEALECFEQAVEKNPKLPTARNNIGNLLKDRARGMDALPQYRKSMELNPDDRDAPSNYLLCHMYIPDMDPKLVFEEHKKWGVSTTKKFPPAFKFKPREAGAKIRVGFLSADLCHHPVAHFIEPIFRGYDRERFEFVAYGDQRKSDEFSARFAKQVDLWRETSSYDDRALAKLIHDDRVDILFELAGHTAYNRLGVFALKPAPVQVSYLGYPGTTGLPTIDFRITDAFADPQGTTEHLHTEKLIRVPECAWCFEPDASAPEVEPLPALKNGYVTFGCFNNMAKLNPFLFETWAEILLRVPGSHLRLKARTLTDDGVRKELKSYFTERGIEEDRLDFFGHTKKIADHLNHYHSVDIALDSFPYHGTTTTCEAMWMGCPVVTRAGKVHVSRVGVSLLNAVGLQEFITETREAYIEKAVALAAQTDRLQELRSSMRERLKNSVLMDEKRFVQGFEKAITEMATLGGLARS